MIQEEEPLVLPQEEVEEIQLITTEEPMLMAATISLPQEENIQVQEELIEEEPEQIIVVEDKPEAEVIPIKEEITVMEQRSSAPMMLQSTEPPVVENTPSYPFAVTYHFYYRNPSNV